MSHSVEAHLHVTTEDYDREIRRFIPGYDQMFDQIVAILSSNSRGTKWTELGSGTGALAERLLQVYPKAHLRLLDCDPAMLAEAKKRLEKQEARTEYLLADFESLPIGWPNDAIVASLSLHHVRTAEKKREIYRKVLNSLRPGGLFVNADVMISDEPWFRELSYQAIVDHMAQNGIDEAEANLHFAAWSEEDRYFSVDEEIQMLRWAGFQQIEVLWRSGPLGVLAAF